MLHFWPFVLLFLATVPLIGVATTVVPWNNMEIMHTWHTIPVIGRLWATYPLDPLSTSILYSGLAERMP